MPQKRQEGAGCLLKRIRVCLLFVKRRHFHRGRADGMRRSKLSRPSKRRVDPVRCVPKVKRNMMEEEKQARKDACAAIAAEKAQRAAAHAETVRATQPETP